MILGAQLKESCNQQQAQMLKELETMVKIETPTGYEEGLKKLRQTIIPWFEKIGCSTELLTSPEGVSTLVATLKGKGKKKIMLQAHLDTVFPVGTEAGNPFRIENGKLRGPGCIDCKAGVVIGLHAMQLLQKNNFTDFARITFVMNSDEETSSLHSKDFIKQIAQEHDVAIVLEAAKPRHGICVARKGMGKGVLTVKGKSVHAARYEQGINAVEEICHQILQFRKLTDKAKGTAVNITVVEGGKVTNTIPDYASAAVDVRVWDTTEFDRITKEAAQINKNTLNPGAKAGFTIHFLPAFPENAKTKALVAKLQPIYAEMGETMETVTSPGISDGNYIYTTGTPVIDGMSCIGMHAHTKDEDGAPESIPVALYALTRFIMEV